MRAPLIKLYGEDYFRRTWSAWMDCMKQIVEQKQGDICKESLNKIKCPTLIIHGKKDVAVDKVHPIYLKEHIANSE